MDEYLVGFYSLLTVVSNAVMNISGPISLRGLFNYFGYMSRNGIAGS